MLATKKVPPMVAARAKTTVTSKRGMPAIGRKDDGVDGTKPAKDRWDLLPWRAVGDVVKVMSYGALKYAPGNWVKVPEWRWRYYAAALRHLTAWWLGEKLDSDSGLPHLAHAVCCILFMAELDQ